MPYKASFCVKHSPSSQHTNRAQLPTLIFHTNKQTKIITLIHFWGVFYIVWVEELSYISGLEFTVFINKYVLILTGTAKNILKIWKELGYLDKAALAKVQERIREFVVPHDVGKIPKITESGFDRFSADKYKNRTI